MSTPPLLDDDEGAQALAGSVKALRRLEVTLKKSLKPLSELDKVSGASLRSSPGKVLERHNGLAAITKHNTTTAVMVSPEIYRDMVQACRDYETLLQREQRRVLQEAGDQFDQLYAKITAKASRQASDALFSADDPSINASFKPGATER